MISKASTNYKKMRLMSLDDTKLIKSNHEKGLRFEGNCKKAASIIKNEKQKKAKLEKEAHVLKIEPEPYLTL